VTWVIAHRGASWDEPENTLPAFERAIAMGADFVELDVQAAADGGLVVCHDTDLDRLTPLRGPLRRRPLAELVAVGIPTLEEVLELCRGRVRVMAELKSPRLYRRHDVVARTVALLGPDDVVLSFERRAVQEARRLRPALRVLQHVGYGTSIRAAAAYAWAVGFHDPRVTRRGLAKAAALGLRTTVYTVNDPERMRRLAALGVDGIFTDRPDLLRATVPPRPPRPA
jgi:glycerophosphoryl diester phosphodiesterase